MMEFPLLPRSAHADITRLARKKYRLAEKKVVLEGARLIADVIDEAPGAIALCVVDASKIDRYADILARMQSNGVDVFATSERVMSRLGGTVSPQGILAVASFSTLAPSDAAARAADGGVSVGLVGVADPGNLGTVIRTCDWFGVSALFLTGGCVEPTNPKVVRSTMGSLFRVPLAAASSPQEILSAVRTRGLTIVAAVGSGGSPPGEIGWEKPLLVFLGSEAHGLPGEILSAADITVTIPGRGGAESLNVAVAHGILLYHLSTLPWKRRSPSPFDHP
ncbi:MAG: RNA methyltransferase [Bacteroidota bacterium]|nr:RNA methyltransferase [Bacteroidota bacterium]